MDELDNEPLVSSIARLSDDILASIFLLNMQYSPGDSSFHRIFNEVITTRYTSQVCSRWRTIALAYPLLWDCIIVLGFGPRIWKTLFSLEWIEEYLQRSMQSSIDLVCYDFSRLPMNWFSVVASRLRSFRGPLSFFDWDALVNEISRPTSCLEHLAIDIDICYQVSPIFSLKTYHQPSPRLKSVRLQNAIFDLRSPMFPSLTSLVIVAPRPRISPSHLLAILSSLPLLLQLDVNSVLTEESVELTQPSTVSLNHLLNLYLDENGKPSGCLLSHLIVPAQCHVDLHILDDFHNDTFRPYLDNIMMFYARQILGEFRLHTVVSFVMLVPLSGKMTFNQSCGSITSQNDSETKCSHLSIHCGNGLLSERRWVETLSSFLSAIRPALSKITSLEWEVPHQHPDILPYLNMMTNLREPNRSQDTEQDSLDWLVARNKRSQA